MDSRRDFTSKKVFSGYFSELGEKANSALLVYTRLDKKKGRRALRALFSDKSLQVRGLSLVNKSKKASTCRR